MPSPRFAAVDDYTADLLSLVSSPHPSTDYEWSLFREAIVTASLFDGIVRPNDMRPMLADRVAPRRVGSFYRKACLEGLIEPTDDWQVSDDAHGRNVGKPARIYRRTRSTSEPSVPAGGPQGRPAIPRSAGRPAP